MSNFIVFYHAPASAMEQMATATPEQKEEGMKPWMAWKASMSDKVVDFGAPLGQGKVLLADGSSQSTDNEICGYSILQAADMEEAASLVAEHPHLSWAEGCKIEIHECMDMSC